ncbi:unnamed protein product, partial [Rotaria socialis]
MVFKKMWSRHMMFK